MLSNLAELNLNAEPALISHYNNQPHDRRLRLGGRARPGRRGYRHSQVMKDFEKATSARHADGASRPGGDHDVLVHRPGAGVAVAIVLVYLLIVVNFQSWLDPFIIITALPGALAGILWMLLLDAYHAERAVADGNDHVHGRGDGQQHSAGFVRARTDERRRDRGRSGAGSRLRSHPAGADDGAWP